MESRYVSSWNAGSVGTSSLTPTSSPLHKDIADAATEVVEGTRHGQASQEKPCGFLRL